MRISTATHVPHDEAKAASVDERVNARRQFQLLADIMDACRAGDIDRVRELAGTL